MAMLADSRSLFAAFLAVLAQFDDLAALH